MIAASVDVTDLVMVARFRSAVAEPIDALRSRRGGPDDVLETDPIVVPVTPIKDHPMAPTPGGPLPSPFLPVT